jgi:hypothetical protein
MKPQTTSVESARLGTWSKVCLGILLAALLFFLFTEHTAHTLGILPYAIFLACPLMHFFMHRGHGHAVDKATSDIHSNKEAHHGP